ncbi:MAG: hypothetical protein EOP05_06205, partial [Proteobacteria bacterium]
MSKSVLLTLVLLFALTACGPNGGFTVSNNSKHGVINSPSDDGTPEFPDVPGNGQPGDLGICSALSLQGVTWPTKLAVPERRALALGLNISGSFEGRSGWSNLTNNFDDQGFSFGLLNQNLGQGSLQPLFIKMRDRNGATFKSLFSKSHYSSLLGMLSDYESASLNLRSLATIGGPTDMSFAPRADGRLSELDEPVSAIVALAEDHDTVRAYSAISDSVDWAVDTLYTDNGKTFQSVWKAELLKLGSHPDYVSLQIEAAQKIHLKALDYMSDLK